MVNASKIMTTEVLEQREVTSTCDSVIAWRYFLVRACTCPLPCLSKHLPFLGGRTLIEMGTLGVLFACALYFTLTVEGKVAGGRVDYFGLIMIVLAARNNVLTWAFGVSFERAIFWHKAMAVATLVALSIHASHSGNNGTGIVIVTLFCFIFPLYAVKPYLFELFYYLHMGIFVALIVVTHLHGARLIPFAGIAWGFDLLIRYVLNLKSVQAEAFLLPGDIIKIQFDKSFVYEPGQYCFLRVGDVANLEFHPFSISTAPHQAKTSLHIRALGDWTKRLKAKIESSVPQRDAEAGGGGHPASAQGVPLRINIEGPFGVPSVNLRDPRYTVFLLISGGIGITPNQSILNHLVEEKQSGRRPSLRKVFFVWSVKDRATMHSVLGTTSECGNEIASELPLSFQPAPISICEDVNETGTELAVLAPNDQQSVASAVKGETSLDSAEVFHSEYYLSVPRAEEDFAAGNIFPREQPNVKFGRPDVIDLFNRTRTLCLREGISRVAVFVCGPAALVADTCDTALAMSAGRCGCVGVAFDCHSEVFDL